MQYALNKKAAEQLVFWLFIILSLNELLYVLNIYDTLSHEKNPLSENLHF